jgi:uncharacterized membrane protein (DUF4010 family)
MSFLLGLGLREYYLAGRKKLIFGSTRSCVFSGILGFALFQLGAEGAFYIAGFLVLGYLLGVFYRYKLTHHEYGIIGVLIAFLCYTIGPISLVLPNWFLILYVMAILFVLNAKDKIYRLTQTVANQELITLAKFLVLSGVILPLTPKGPIASFLPVSVYQTWLSVVVISGISYCAYLLQTYFVRGASISLTGAIGGLYSSTATSVVLARQSRLYSPSSLQPAMAITLSTTVMYLRLWVVIAIFRWDLAFAFMAGFFGLSLLSGALAFGMKMLEKNGQVHPSDVPVEATHNPLEVSAAIIFALSFLLVTALTHLILQYRPDQGLQWMAAVSGLTDIYPFVLAIVQGQSHLPLERLAKAILLASASNDLLKAIYVYLLSRGRTRIYAPLALLLTAVGTLIYAYMLI